MHFPVESILIRNDISEYQQLNTNLWEFQIMIIFREVDYYKTYT